jgi:hypothetical protein
MHARLGHRCITFTRRTSLCKHQELAAGFDPAVEVSSQHGDEMIDEVASSSWSIDSNV